MWILCTIAITKTRNKVYKAYTLRWHHRLMIWKSIVIIANYIPSCSFASFVFLQRKSDGTTRHDTRLDPMPKAILMIDSSFCLLSLYLTTHHRLCPTRKMPFNCISVFIFLSHFGIHAPLNDTRWLIHFWIFGTRESFGLVPPRIQMAGAIRFPVRSRPYSHPQIELRLTDPSLVFLFFFGMVLAIRSL